LCKSGAILLGYGAGNANTIKHSERSILEPLRNAIRKNKYVVILHRLPLNLTMQSMKVGGNFLRMGEYPPETLQLQMRMVNELYLGHKETIRKMAKTSNLNFDLLVIASFLSGVTLSKIQIEELKLRLEREKRESFPISILILLFSTILKLRLKWLLRT